jgi:hypothetical protein
MSKELEFLGIVVGKDGPKVDPKKMEVIEMWPRPEYI